jgi:AraC-like DNA-binding protein
MPPMDALSDILRVVGLTGGVFLDAEFSAPWAIAGKVGPEQCTPFMVAPREVICFHYVVEGEFLLVVGDGEPMRVQAGEALLLPRNPLHVLASDANTPVVPVGDILKPSGEPGLARLTYGGGGARTRLVCGFLGGNEQMNLLVSNLPAAMIVDLESMPGGDWVARSFTYAAQTLAEGDPGAATVLTKLSELLFVETVRRFLSALPADRTGWMAGLRDPAVAKALALLHSDVAADWTAEGLARAVNMSRSAFAERFTAIVGQPPMRYLTAWRMQRAARDLVESRRSIAQIAHGIGYESEAAFTRAFRREFGAPPAAWRREAAQ